MLRSSDPCAKIDVLAEILTGVAIDIGINMPIGVWIDMLADVVATLLIRTAVNRLADDLSTTVPEFTASVSLEKTPPACGA